MTDYYLQDKSRLNGQPKRTIGDYVESQGILVPRRFDTLQEARASKLPILCRSEHVQEYDGVSGLVGSPRLEKYPDTNSDEELKNTILERIEQVHNQEGIETTLQTYCTLLDLNLAELKSQTSFSYWENLAGANQLITADSAVNGLYHIFTSCKKVCNYSQFDHGKMVSENDEFMNVALPENFQNGLPLLVQAYEKIRHLSHFDRNHCPIMEFVTVDDKSYFVQYHRSRDFQPPAFVLDPKMEESESEAVATRGATPVSGLRVAVTVAYGANALGIRNHSKWPLPAAEEGSFDFHINTIFSELMVRKRKVQAIANKNIADFWARTAQRISHYYLSKFFKPQVSVFFDQEKVMSNEEYEQLRQKAKETREDQSLTLHLISDGRKAYVKRV